MVWFDLAENICWVWGSVGGREVRGKKSYQIRAGEASSCFQGILSRALVLLVGWMPHSYG